MKKLTAILLCGVMLSSCSITNIKQRKKQRRNMTTQQWKRESFKTKTIFGVLAITAIVIVASEYND
ncbi:MAG: hypothetical protein HRU40_07470 [Saprospiraceae bacterium]|nr:hypothetical protein [Saprospiraceae bacterium]